MPPIGHQALAPLWPLIGRAMRPEPVSVNTRPEPLAHRPTSTHGLGAAFLFGTGLGTPTDPTFQPATRSTTTTLPMDDASRTLAMDARLPAMPGVLPSAPAPSSSTQPYAASNLSSHLNLSATRLPSDHSSDEIPLGGRPTTPLPPPTIPQIVHLSPPPLVSAEAAEQ